MSKPDLDLVVSRRAMISRERTELEKLRAELDAEEAELDVAERVLKRLAEGNSVRVRSSGPAPVDSPATVPAMGDPAKPIREG